jgi:hypothetical protein
MDYPKITVFCGFRGLIHSGEKRSTEKDFVYRLLKIFHTGSLNKTSLRKGVGENLTAGSPLFGKFYFVEELGEGNPVTADKQLLDSCDFALVILPNRPAHSQTKTGDFPTSNYALMEYGLVCGADMPGIVIAERGVPIDKLGFAPLLHRWPDDIDDHTIRTKVQQRKLKRFFDKILVSFYLKKPLMSGLPKYKVDEFYRDYLIRLLLQWHEIRIYNHSILPLSSSFDPANLGVTNGSPWEDFNGVQAYYARQPHRALYFELEEAILTGSDSRLRRLVDTLGHRAFSAELLSEIDSRARLKRLQQFFSLLRYASLIPSDVWRTLDPNNRKRAVARNLSVLLQMFRIQRAVNRRLRVRYELYGFQTAYAHSMPTTIYAEHSQREKGAVKKCASVWGFLRSSASLDPRERDDAFIVARNCPCVDVWERHLDEVGGKEGEVEPRLLLSPGRNADFGAFFELIGDQMKNLLRGELTRRNWRAVLRTAGI